MFLVRFSDVFFKFYEKISIPYSVLSTNFVESAPTSGGKRSPPASGDDSLQSAPSESKRIRRPPPDDEDQSSNHAPFTSKPSESENKGYFASKAHDTDDPVRLKAREMIKKALDNKRVWFRVTLILTLSKCNHVVSKCHFYAFCSTTAWSFRVRLSSNGD